MTSLPSYLLLMSKYSFDDTTKAKVANAKYVTRSTNIYTASNDNGAKLDLTSFMDDTYEVSNSNQ